MKVLLVDDDVELVGMLQEYLNNEGVSVDVCYNGQTGIAKVESAQYDAMFLDIMLPDMNGLDVLKYIRKHNDIPIIMLTARGDNLDRVTGLEMGADDYIPKPCYPREVLARLKAILRRSRDEITQKFETSLTFYEFTLDLLQHTCYWKNQPLELTVTEFNLLTVLLKYQDRVVTKDELSEKGIGRVRELYDRSIDVHISKIRQKLYQFTEGDITIETIRSIGYRIRAAQ